MSAMVKAKAAEVAKQSAQQAAARGVDLKIAADAEATEAVEVVVAPRPISRETLKSRIAQLSTLGEILKMMPDCPVDEYVLGAIKRADESKSESDLAHDLLEMHVITEEQLKHAQSLQRKMRSQTNLPSLLAFFEEVRLAAEQARATLTKKLTECPCAKIQD